MRQIRPQPIIHSRRFITLIRGLRIDHQPVQTPSMTVVCSSVHRQYYRVIGLALAFHLFLVDIPYPADLSALFVTDDLERLSRSFDIFSVECVSELLDLGQARCACTYHCDPYNIRRRCDCHFCYLILSRRPVIVSGTDMLCERLVAVLVEWKVEQARYVRLYRRTGGERKVSRYSQRYTHFLISGRLHDAIGNRPRLQGGIPIAILYPLILWALHLI